MRVCSGWSPPGRAALTGSEAWYLRFLYRLDVRNVSDDKLRRFALSELMEHVVTPPPWKLQRAHVSRRAHAHRRGPSGQQAARQPTNHRPSPPRLRRCPRVDSAGARAPARLPVWQRCHRPGAHRSGVWQALALHAGRRCTAQRPRALCSRHTKLALERRRARGQK